MKCPALGPTALAAAISCGAALPVAANVAALTPGAPQDAASHADAVKEVRIEGAVLMPGGAPAQGAVVVSSAGGSAAVGADGSFALDLTLDHETPAVELTAVANGSAGTLMAHRRLDDLRAGAPTRNAGALYLAQSQACAPSWIPTFGGVPGVDDVIYALAVFDDGSGAGPALYAGGAFSAAGGKTAHGIARWDGESWSPVGPGLLAATVSALAVFDDGSGAGPALYAGGGILGGIVKWDGQSWTTPGGGANGAALAMTVFDDGTGSGPALYAAGVFTIAGGISANRIAKWDGQSWSALSHGTNDVIDALTVFDDGSGSGPALYAGGNFTSAGGVSATRVAKWNGQAWSAVGSGANGPVRALTVFDDGAGSALYAGGEFIPGFDVRKWDGQSWSAVGNTASQGVYALATFDDGSGPALYAGGVFGSTSLNGILKWDGQAWTTLSGGTNDAVQALAVFDDGRGSGPALFAGGWFTSAGSQSASRIAKWDGQSWSAFSNGMDDPVLALAVFDDGLGVGPALYAGGMFLSAQDQNLSRIAKWDGQSWSALGSGMNGAVRALCVFDDGSGSGPALFAGGDFTSAGGVSANGIAKWDGLGWSALGSGVAGFVYALCEFDDGSGGGAALYAGGQFTTAGGASANRIAKWDGQTWSALSTGMNQQVNALITFDDGLGAGPALYAGGTFTTAGAVSANGVAKWDGQSWSPLGSGVFYFPTGPDARAFAVLDDGFGPKLYVGGNFLVAGGQPANYIARWDGLGWSTLDFGLNHQVYTLASFDDGSGAGPALYAGGFFAFAGATPASRIAKWDGRSWNALGSGVNDIVSAMTVFAAPGESPALYIGGSFSASPAGDSFLAKWGCAAIGSLYGCAGNPAKLEALAASAPLGAPLPLRITGSAAYSGIGVLAYGGPGIDGNGCGLVVPGIGELLLALAPAPKTLPSGVLAGGICDLAPLVPSTPALSGVLAYLQGAAVDFALLQPIELTNALAVTLGP